MHGRPPHLPGSEVIREIRSLMYAAYHCRGCGATDAGKMVGSSPTTSTRGLKTYSLPSGSNTSRFPWWFGLEITPSSSIRSTMRAARL